MQVKEGDVVEGMSHKGWVKVKVLRIYDSGKILYRQVGVTKGGARYAARRGDAGDIRPFVPLEPQQANVYADWLEEHGEPRAAGKLREAFPLADASEVSR